MDTIGSLVTIILVLAAIVVPQALVLYFKTPANVEAEEYEYDYR